MSNIIMKLICEDCGIIYTREKISPTQRCDYCARRMYNLRAKNQEYIPYLKMTEEEQKKLDSRRHFVNNREKEKYLKFRENQRTEMKAKEPTSENTKINVNEIKEETTKEIIKDTDEVINNTEKKLTTYKAFDVINTLQELSKIFYEYYFNLKQLRAKLEELDKEETDKVHQIALGLGTDEQLLKISKEYRNILKERRETKDTLEELELIKDFVDKYFHENQMGRDITTTINALYNLKKKRATRKYYPRVDTELLKEEWTADQMYTEETEGEQDE